MSMSKNILVTGTSVRADLLQPLIDAGYSIDNPTHLLTETELKEALKSSVAYLLGGDEYATKLALSSARDLKVVAFLGMGYESFVDAQAARELGILVTNTPGTLSNAVAELTIGLVLCSTRKLYLYASNWAGGRSGGEDKQRDLAALHVGIVGLGGVGIRIAEILRGGFGCKVSYYSRSRKRPLEDKLGIEYLDLAGLASQVEVMIIMTPSNAETKGLIGESQISAFRPGTILVNTARPDIVDPLALLKGIETNRIEYAAFDDFYEEPKDAVAKLKALVPSKLMVTPHIGSLTHQARDGMARKAIASILNILSTGTDPNVVNGQ
jgi:lactate dehydrogenase-like 2-hydroxyacid dehydrogenase